MMPYYRTIGDLESELEYRIRMDYHVDPYVLRHGLLRRDSLEFWWATGLPADRVLLQTLGVPKAERAA